MNPNSAVDQITISARAGEMRHGDGRVAEELDQEVATHQVHAVSVTPSKPALRHEGGSMGKLVRRRARG
jgi:hypothetical protein